MNKACQSWQKNSSVNDQNSRHVLKLKSQSKSISIHCIHSNNNNNSLLMSKLFSSETVEFAQWMNASSNKCLVLTLERISWCRLSIYTMLYLLKILLSSKNLYRKFTAASTSHHLWMEKERSRSTRGFPWVCIHAHLPSNLLYHFLKFTVGNLLLLLYYKLLKYPKINI